ncbi:flagellar filament capping protein FliD [Christensenellaceae bacterium OttesenSCG-928-M15]|nr:flagellar filament capping protein FliD [Christensenellaceae bacterium OttesenSCG-928-M15]
MSISSVNRNRIVGLSSGMDTESLVKNALYAEQLKIDKLFRANEKETWKLSIYNDIKSSVSTLRNDYLSVIGSKSVVKSATYNAFKVNTTANNALKVSATGNALAGSVKIKSIQMATATTMKSSAGSRVVGYYGEGSNFLQATGTSANPINDNLGNQITADTTVSDVAGQFGIGTDESLAFSINGETFTFASTATMQDVMDEVNASSKANVNMSLEDGKFTITSKKVGDESKVEISGIGSNLGGFGFKNADVKLQSAIDGSTTIGQLEELGVNFGWKTDDGNYTFNLNGTPFEFNEADSIQSVMDQVNIADLGVKMSYNESLGRFRIENEDPSSLEPINAQGVLFSNGLFNLGSKTESMANSTPMMGINRSDTLSNVLLKMGKSNADIPATLNVKINGEEFSFDTATTTITDMMSAINNNKDVGATFSYSELSDTFSVTSGTTGSNAALKVEGLEAFGLGSSAQITRGKDAVLTLDDGNDTRVVQTSNKFTLDGLEFEITDDYNLNNDPSVASITIGVERDYQSTIDQVKGFIEDYNKAVEQLNKYYYEQVPAKDRGKYQPLTTEEREAMTEKEAETWDEKAKVGILRNDATLGNLLTELRSSLMVKVESTGLSAMDLGITTVSWNSDNWRTDQGKLQLDEDVLRSKLEENPDAVQATLAGTVLGSDNKADVNVTTANGTSSAKSGLFVRLSSIMNNFDQTMKYTTIEASSSKITDYAKRIADMEDKMATKEERLWAKYTAMETALSEMESQMNWITQQFSSSN